MLFNRKSENTPKMFWVSLKAEKNWNGKFTKHNLFFKMVKHQIITFNSYQSLNLKFADIFSESHFFKFSRTLVH